LVTLSFMFKVYGQKGTKVINYIIY